MEYQSVRLQALDHLGLERVDFMKVDVEGTEMRVFRGARATIERSRPIILSELSPEMLKRVSGVPVRTFFDFFQALGYRCFIVDKQRCGEEVVEFPDKWDKELINLGLVPVQRDPAIFLSHLALHPDTGWLEEAQMRPTGL
jgi:hypothetical protein